ncbi:Rieske (2Fe-2S) protein [Ferruginibacter albus]|uniref:Rieske (2Fe-2S) protein n=1 Tax=Ferruginibacter albus TaxID=2875540 RepID=UPI001CC674F1|nr:Rieske 2Fe-2S domain-containing protein [Ferruginibacter albus]UAY52028.1 Rieske 2Fe-2S domain-containing protein [Ferruginibacter albus]
MKRYKWHKIADSVEELPFNENNLLEVEVAGKIVCMAKHNDVLHACSQKCPHAGAYMEEGYIDALGNIVCPIHRYKFSLQNGRNTSGEGYFLKTFPIETRADGIYIGLEQEGLFSWLK